MLVAKKLIQGVTLSSWQSERSISGLVVEYIAIDVTRDDSHSLLTDTAPAKVQAIGLVIHWILFDEACEVAQRGWPLFVSSPGSLHCARLGV